MVVRCTNKLLSLLGKKKLLLVEAEASDEDWYGNLLWFERRKCLLLVHAGTLFPILVVDVRVPELRPFEQRVVELIEAALLEEGLPQDVLGLLDPGNVQLAKTASRQVLGVMNQMASECGWLFEQAGGLANVEVGEVNHGLRRRLHTKGGGYHEPLELVLARLGERR